MSRIPYDVDSLGVPQGEVGARLKAFRIGQRLSLREFSQRLSRGGHHVSHTAVAKYEYGELKITADYLELVATAFGIPYRWFISGLNDQELGAEYPSLKAAGLEDLPSYAHASVASRLDRLAVECGVPEGPVRMAFFRTVGGLLQAPFRTSEGFLRSWQELSDKELMGYLTGQLTLLRTLLRKPSAIEVPVPMPSPGEGRKLPAGARIRKVT